MEPRTHDYLCRCRTCKPPLHPSDGVAVAARAWLGGIFVGIVIVTITVIVPGLVNMHNDGALLAVPLVMGVIGTAAYFVFKVLFPKDAE